MSVVVLRRRESREIDIVKSLVERFWVEFSRQACRFSGLGFRV